MEDMEKKKILIADDDMGLLTVLSVRLRREGFEVLTAQDCYYALSQAANHHPDVIIMDVNMPCGDGFGVHDRLRNMALMSIPIIYLTGEKSERVAELAEQLGAFAVIHKPYDADTLLATVRRALGE